MKLKLYITLIALCILSKSFSAITTQILSPEKNSVDTGVLKISVKITTTNDLQYVKAKILNSEIDLTYNSSSKNFTGDFNLTGYPQQLLTLKVTCADVLNNLDSSSVDFYYDHAPQLTVVWPGGKKYPFVKEPYLHITANCLADSGHCTINIYNRNTNTLLATGLNVLDTVIDVSGIAALGYWGGTDTGRNNYLRIKATDRMGIAAGKSVDYILEPSAYIEEYNDTIYPHLVSAYVTAKDENSYPYINVTIKGDTTFNAHPTFSPYGDPFTDPGIESSYFTYNDNFVFWASRISGESGSLYDIKKHTFTGFTPVTRYAIPGNLNLSVDTSGNTVVGYNAVINGKNFVYTTNGEGDQYLSFLYFNKNNGTDTFIDTFFFKRVTPFDQYLRAKVNSGYVAYYRPGLLNQRVVWVWDSTGLKRRVSVVSNDTYLYNLSENGDILYGFQQGADNNYVTYWNDRFGNNKRIASFGSYYENRGQPLLSTVLGYYKININVGEDSLLPFKREVKKDSSYSFSTHDFDNAFKGPGYLFKVRITKLPLHGTLYLNKVAITKDSTLVNHVDLVRLSYKPVTGYSGKDTVRWTASDGANYVTGDTIIALSVVSALPVTLLNFTGEALGKGNQLKWQTAVEQNVGYFSVEKSIDGFSFAPIGNVKAKGNSNVITTYGYYDDQLYNNKNYYRLKITDNDGIYQYSKIIVLQNSLNKATYLYPNPAKGTAYISFSGQQAGRYQVMLYNAEGKTLSSQSIVLSAGNQTISLPLGNTASGVYMVKVIDDKGKAILQQKLVKQ